jgi:hypothetical protein
MEQHDKNQHDGAYTDGRHGFEFIWDPGQKRWNIAHAVTLLSQYEERLVSYLPLSGKSLPPGPQAPFQIII